MAEFLPVETLPDLFAQDGAEVIDGYWSGYRGEPEPLSSTCSRSRWHGWRNGAVDGGHRDPDPAQARLVSVFVAAGSGCLQ